MYLRVFEVEVEGEEIRTPWEWEEPNYPYSMWELTEYRFTRFVGRNVYAQNKITGEKRFLYFRAWTDYRRVPLTNPIEEPRHLPWEE